MATAIRDLLDEGTAHLGRVADDPRHEAEILLCAALGRARTFLRAHPEEQVLDCEATDRYEAHLTRRGLGEPIAYILGEKEFWSLPLAVGPGVLIPRAETELLVERALAQLPVDQAGAVLDLATGSGALALAIANERPLARVVASDRSDAALDAARRNVERLALGARVEIVQGSWFSAVAGQRFDLIVCNPPYIALEDKRVDPAVRRFEPGEALFAGPTGLEALHTVILDSPGFLVSGGWLAVEHGDQQGMQVRALFDRAGFVQIETHRDLAGLDRCTEGRIAAR